MLRITEARKHCIDVYVHSKTWAGKGISCRRYLYPPLSASNGFSRLEIQPNLPCKDKTKVSERKGIIRTQFPTKDKKTLIILFENGNKKHKADNAHIYFICGSLDVYGICTLITNGTYKNLHHAGTILKKLVLYSVVLQSFCYYPCGLHYIWGLFW